MCFNLKTPGYLGNMATSIPCLIAAFCLLSLCTTSSDAIGCYECNAYYLGQRTSTCDAPFNKSNCVACLKTITKVKLRDSGYILGWERVSEVLTKYCARVKNSPGLRKEGCYNQENNGGYTRRCFCYSDYCNKATQLVHAAAPLWVYAVVSLGLAVLQQVV